MSAGLKLSVALRTLQDDLSAGANVVGNIYPASRGGVAQRDIVIPCGPAVEPRRFDVEPGRYVVSATLPSGTVLTEDVEAREGEDVVVQLDAMDSPYETHAWQYLLGNIESGSVYHRTGTVPIPRSTGSRTVEEQPFAAAGPPVVTTPKVTWIGDSKDSSWSFEAMLAMAAEPAAETVAATIADRWPPRVLPHPDETDGTSHLYHFDETGPVGLLGAGHGARQFLLVEIGSVRHLVTLPTPWGSSLVEVLVNARQSPTGSAVAVTVRDPAVGAGLAYMARGALESAAQLFTDVELMLYTKMANPLAAAAGAYVLVGTDITDERRGWDPWLRNLHDWFGWMSDGAILLATRQLQQARTQDDLDRARGELIKAYDQGVPYYTLGLSWLMDGLSEFPDDRECASRLERARRLSWCVDMREPFLIMTHGRSGAS
jgi:hypothetical protein